MKTKLRQDRNHGQRAERCLERKVKTMHSDNGTEIAKEHFRKYFEERGIKHEFTNMYSPEQNSAVERIYQTVANGTHSILTHQTMSLKF